MYTLRTKKASGFTIVELLIVIVIIAILAGLVITTFVSAQDRARFSVMQADLKEITKALALYHAANESYPVTTGQAGCTYYWCGWNQATGNNFINGLAPQYISKTPQLPLENASNDTYIYRSDGKDYQLLRYKAAGLSSAEMTNNPLLAMGNGYDGIAWGYKTNDGAWW